MTQIELVHRPIQVAVLWELFERTTHAPLRKTYNLLTSYGLTAFAAAPSGTYTPPIYLVLDTAFTTIATPGNNVAGDTVVLLAADPTITGDTQLVLSLGQAAQETVTFSSKTGTGPYTFTLTSGCVNGHTFGDFVGRAVNANDTLSSVVSEGQYDPTYFAGLRAPMTAQYSPGTGQSTMQFFIAGIQATNMFMAHVGLADALAIGAGNLHNYAALGFNHNSVSDLEIDVTWTLTTS